MRQLLRTLAMTAMLSQAACYNSPPEHVGVWSEFLPLDQVRGELPALAVRHCELYLAVNPMTLNDDMAAFVAEANSAGVPVRLWLQIPSEGIWLNDENADAFADFTNTTLDWIDAHELPVNWLIFDIEPAYEYAEALADSFANIGLLAAFDLFQMHRDLSEFNAARTTIQSMLDVIHARGRQVMAVTLPWVVNDVRDGDEDLQDIFDTPFAMLDWDAVSFTLYRSSLSEIVGVPLTPAFVTEYAIGIRALYGDDAEIAIGTISTPGLITSTGYEVPLDISWDVMAVRAAGLRNISVYSLDGMLVAGGTTPWLDAATGPTLTVPVVDPLSGFTPFLFNGLDVLADE